MRTNLLPDAHSAPEEAKWLIGMANEVSLLF